MTMLLKIGLISNFNCMFLNIDVSLFDDTVNFLVSDTLLKPMSEEITTKNKRKKLHNLQVQRNGTVH